MANNPDRQGNNNANNNNMNEHVEFTVRAEEDLYLTGSENTLRRVTADTNYSCLMLKTQRFSSLFRHYAKYHGLRKDDLEYYFVNPLENEDTPETVHLQRGDIIMVRKKRKAEAPEPSADDGEFFKDMKELLDDEEHMDTLFLVHPYITATAVGKNRRAAEAASKSVSNNKTTTPTKNASNPIPSIPIPAPPPP
jgi:speckle-type POZ protein